MRCHPERSEAKSRDRLKTLATVSAFLCLAAMPMSAAQSPADQGYMQAMSGMNHTMSSVRMTGDADDDFLAMMIAHHEGAVSMCRVELRYGHDGTVLALCRNIIASQSNQIKEMQQLLRR